jgi:tRNA A-37 threonylcarbamoyl transferase component Bud32
MIDSPVGRTVGKYKIVEHLGRGGMAEVYKAYQETLDRHVAIKLMHSFLAGDQDFLSRFKREARAMASLAHPGIVGVYDFDIQGDTYYIVMEFVGGGTLKEKLEHLASQGETLSMSRTVQVVLEIAEALSYAHSRSMVHRDIKPANIMLREDGRAVLTDFGIAKMLSGPSYTATGAMIGTPAYMSPEQGLGQPGDERSDLYSLGVLFFQMATGRLPYDADTPLAVVLKHVNEPVPTPITFNRSVPAGIQMVIMKAMAKNPVERYQTAHEMARALRDVVKSEDLHLVHALPADLLQDKPTPPPVPAVTTQGGPVGATKVAGAAAAGTIVAGQGRTQVGAPATMVGTGPGERTEIVAAPVREAAAAPAGRRRSPWLWVGVGLIVLLLAAGAVAGAATLAGRDPTPTVTLVAVVEDTEEPTNTPPPGASNTPIPTPTAVDVQAEVAAALTRVAASQPTATTGPTSTMTPTPTETPDVTATYLAGCTYSVSLIDAYTFQNRDFNSAPVNAEFPMNWILKNDGTCTWPTGLQWTYVEGEEFEQQGPLTVVGIVAAEEETTLTTLFDAPSFADTYDVTWQLVEPNGQPFGEPIEFEVRIYLPTTPTPAIPTPTTGPAATATVPTTAVGFNIFPDNGCEYPGDGVNWRCAMVITPFGGGGGPYTVWVFDSSPPAHYGPGGNVTHFITGRRCTPWVNEVRVQDEVTGQSFSRSEYVDPKVLSSFPGGACVEPS